MSPPSEREQLSFLTNLQRLLSEGQFVATYKYALLLALCDMAVEQGDDSGQPLLICTRHIAEKFIQYYWQQTAPYPISPERADSATNAILRQNTGNQAAIINYVSSARTSYPTLADLRRDARMWHQLVRQVDRVIRVMPLWKLQTVGRQSFDFLYENRMTGNAIELKPGVAFCLRRFYPLVSNLSKGDKLAASEHLNGWVERNRLQRTFLAEEFDRRKIIHNLDASKKVASWSYSQAAGAGALAWLRGDLLVHVEPSWLEILSA